VPRPGIARAIIGLGLVPPDLDRVVLTHFHDDHAGAAAEICDWGEVTVMAYHREAPIIRGQLPARQRSTNAQRRRTRAPHGHHRGRTPRHLRRIALLTHSGVLFTSDTIAAGTNSQIILGPFNLNHDQAARFFRRLAALAAPARLFSHGHPILTTRPPSSAKPPADFPRPQITHAATDNPRSAPKRKRRAQPMVQRRTQIAILCRKINPSADAPPLVTSAAVHCLNHRVTRVTSVPAIARPIPSTDALTIGRYWCQMSAGVDHLACQESVLGPHLLGNPLFARMCHERGLS
jgi:glyoxylase-like metal-dependent hydrolase (beta-lactamase superfamily II)